MTTEKDIEIITLEFEDGTEECEILGIFDVEGVEYMALPVSASDEEEAEIYIYKYVEVDEEEFELQDIESDEELEKAMIELNAIMDAEEEL